VTASPHRDRCPRCGNAIRSSQCVVCDLALVCPTCDTDYEDPQGRVCGNCFTPIRQPSWLPARELDTTGQRAEGPFAADNSISAGAANPVRMVPSVADAISRAGQPGVLRIAGAQYAAALLAAGDGKAARRIISAALDAPGNEPAAADLLMLRSRAAELRGDSGEAIRDLLSAAVEARAFPPGVTRHVHDLLDQRDDADLHRFILDDWTPKAADLGLALADLDLLVMHASVLEGDARPAATAFRRLDHAGTPVPPGALSDLIGDLTRVMPPDGQRQLFIALLFRLLGDTGQALFQARQATVAGFDDAGDGGLAALALELQGDLLCQLELTAEAGSAYASAGQDYHRRDDFARAVPLLLKAAQNLPGDADVLFRLADSTRMLAWRSEQADVSLLLEAAATVDAGFACARRDEIPSWPYRLRAYIALDLENLDDPASRHGHLQAGLLAMECAAALSGQADDSGYLASLHRKLEHYATAVATLEHAPDADDDAWRSADARYEAAWVALMAAMPDVAPRVDSYVSDPAADPGNSGLLLVESRRPRAAIRPLERAVEAAPDNLICQWLLGLARRQTSDAPLAAECFNKVRQLRSRQADRGDWQDGYATADACYRLGLVADAVAELDTVRPFTESRPELHADVHKLDTIFHFAAGRSDHAQAAFEQFMAAVKLPWDAYDLARDLSELARKIAATDGREADAHLARAAEAARRRARQLRDDLRQPDAALAELRAELARHAVCDSAAVACNAAIARLAGVLGRPLDAADAALAVLRARPKAPFAAVLTAAVDELLQAGEAELARERLASALSLVSGDDAEVSTGLLARAALAAALCGSGSDAERALSQVMRTGADDSAAGTEAGVAAIWTPLLGGLDGYWRVRRSTGADSTTSRIADKCLATLLRLDESDDDEASWPITTPIRVEIAEDLVPPDTSPTGPMLGTYIPQMRHRLSEAFLGPLAGDDPEIVPGIRVRVDLGLGSGRFRISLHEVPRAEAGIPHGMVFCLAPAAKVTSLLGADGDTVPALDPVTRREACWAPAVQADALERSGITVWRDSLLYVFRELEYQLHRHLDEYLSLDEVDRLLARWTSGHDEHEASAAPGLDRLTAVVRALARDRVSVRDGGALLRAVASAGGVTGAADEYRRTVAGELPGNEDGMPRIPVPPKLGALVSGPPDAPFPAERGVLQALTELRDVLADQPARVSLVAASDAARRAVRKYLSGEFPDIPVLSASEVTPGEPPAQQASPHSEAGVQ